MNNNMGWFMTIKIIMLGHHQLKTPGQLQPVSCGSFMAASIYDPDWLHDRKQPWVQGRFLSWVSPPAMKNTRGTCEPAAIHRRPAARPTFESTPLRIKTYRIIR